MVVLKSWDKYTLNLAVARRPSILYLASNWSSVKGEKGGFFLLEIGLVGWLDVRLVDKTAKPHYVDCWANTVNACVCLVCGVSNRYCTCDIRIIYTVASLNFEA